MRSIHKKILLMLTVALALGVVTSASASAATWWDGGSELASSAPLASATKKVETITISPAPGFTINCSGLELKGGDIAAPNGGAVEHLVFTGCDAEVGSGCGLVGTTIESKPLKLEAALGSKSPEDTLLVKPVSGKVFADWKIEDIEGCEQSGESALEGMAKFILPKGREELAEQELEPHVTKATDELQWGSFGVSVSGKVKVKLTSGKGWSFH
jgi:hypothetical protein